MCACISQENGLWIRKCTSNIETIILEGILFRLGIFLNRVKIHFSRKCGLHSYINIIPLVFVLANRY